MLCHAVATAPDAGRGPILFSKLDIKDGYWRMVVPAKDEWHFACVLPKASPDEPTRLVIPFSLQMNTPGGFLLRPQDWPEDTLETTSA
jgi:hypothetical protein